MQEMQIQSLRMKWQLGPVFLPGKSHGHRILAGYISWGCENSNMTKQLSAHTHTHTHNVLLQIQLKPTILGLILLIVWLFKYKVTKSPFISGIFLQKPLCSFSIATQCLLVFKVLLKKNVFYFVQPGSSLFPKLTMTSTFC